MRRGYLCLGWLLLIFAGPGLAGELPPLPGAFGKKVPETVKDLQAIQTHVQLLAKKVLPAVVGIRIGPSSGSGVIIDAEGYVLTAGHVSGEPNRPADIILHDGRRLKAKTLGANRGIDSGLLKITEKAVFPHAEMGEAVDVKKGDWCLALGHPGGFQSGRSPVLRLGRILDRTPTFLRSDCTLVGGDSGGPLFDMYGRVIGIHSRIGGAITANIHVPVDTYRETFDRLAKGEIWGSSLFGGAAEAYLGIQMDPEAKGCKVQVIAPKSPAERAGLQVNDLILRMDDQKIQSAEDLIRFMRGKQPGNQVGLEVRRGETTLRFRVVLEKRPVG